MNSGCCGPRARPSGLGLPYYFVITIVLRRSPQSWTYNNNGRDKPWLIFCSIITLFLIFQFLACLFSKGNRHGTTKATKGEESRDIYPEATYTCTCPSVAGSITADYSTVVDYSCLGISSSIFNTSCICACVSCVQIHLHQKALHITPCLPFTYPHASLYKTSHM